MLPDIARDMLKLDRQEAEARAAKEDPEGGYRILVAGRDRVKLTFDTGSYPWVKTLVRRYERAIKEYAARYLRKPDDPIEGESP